MRTVLPVFAFCLASIAAQAGWQTEGDFRFHNGDNLEIAVYRFGKTTEVLMKNSVTLDSEGKATLANGRQVKIGFGNFKSATANIEEGYRTGDDLSGLNVEAHVLKHNGKPIVVVLGEVKNPGHGDWTTGMTLADLVAQAGGFTEGAYRKRVAVQRAGAPIIVDCRKEEATRNFSIEIGDIVTVELGTLQL